MDQEINEITVWNDGAPIININPNQEFDIWRDGAPLIDNDGSKSEPTPPITNIRRRCFIF